MKGRVGASLREFFVYLGPALIVSMAYMDPGNYGTDIQGGALFGNGLVWSVWLASLMAMELQYLSGKLGIATGRSLPEMIRTSLNSKYYAFVYWLAAETAAAATDLAEYLGTVLALNILFGIPLLYAAIFGAADVLVILAFATRRFRVIEYLFMLFVSVISIGFLYEIWLVGPNLSDVVAHTFNPSLNEGNIPFVVGIIGATVMPHALFVHSYLARNKLQNDTLEEKRRVRKLHLVESVVTLTIAALVNVAILVATTPLYPLYGGNSACVGPPNSVEDCANSLTVNHAASIMSGLFGALAGTIFAITLLSSGLASSTTGTLAGQAIMEGLLGTRINVYLRRLVTRFVNVFPTVIAILLGLSPLSLLVYSQVVLSLMIPLPMIPLLYYTRKRNVMGEFTNKRVTTLTAVAFAGTIIALNVYLLLTFLGLRLVPA